MTKLVMTFDSFDSLVDDILAYQFNNVTEFINVGIGTSYESVVNLALDYAKEHVPGFFAYDYPNCVHLLVNSYGMQMTKNMNGFSIHCSFDKIKKTRRFELGLIFALDEDELTFNKDYKNAVESGYTVAEVPKKKKK